MLWKSFLETGQAVAGQSYLALAHHGGGDAHDGGVGADDGVVAAEDAGKLAPSSLRLPATLLAHLAGAACATSEAQVSAPLGAPAEGRRWSQSCL